MKFMGDGYVELHTPTDLDDLKAYTELSLSLQRPLSGRGDGKRRRRQVSDDPSDMFVMYLGNRNVSWWAGRTVARYKQCGSSSGGRTGRLVTQKVAGSIPGSS